jgi:phosphoribosyl 1,2-cyclic phosphodiesterase/DNA-binding response OmpR family regulator
LAAPFDLTMKIRFWGTRGSIAKAGPTTVRYGGNTPCVELRSAAGTLIVLDCGTGAHSLGEALTTAGPVRGHLLITHTHWDHIQGLPFFAPLFVAGNEWDVYAPRGLGRQLQDTLAGQMQYAYFPVSLQQCRAALRYHELVEGALTIDDVQVKTRYLNHPALTLGYRLEADGAVVVYATDHEPRSRTLAHGRPLSGSWAGLPALGKDADHAEFLNGADLVIHDTQYTASEYSAKIGWGHSTVEYAVKMATAARAARLALFHHDPLRHDEAVDQLVVLGREKAAASGTSLEIFAAAEGQMIDLGQRATAPASVERPTAPAVPVSAPALLQQSVLIAATDKSISALLTEAVRADGLRLLTAQDGDTALQMVRTERPALVIAERGLPARDALSLCRAIREDADPRTREIPVVLVTATETPADTAAGAVAGVSDWLVTPFSSSYARTKVHAWLLRMCSRWVKAPVPADEDRRLAALHGLGLLDTAAEERFDRLTRLACHVFDVPIVAVSLVDTDRQWFKSCQGMDLRETPREAAFCAYTILGDDTLQVPDTLTDARFAENPLVTGEPRIRFYAGYPLTTPDGSRVGTLCLIDRRPRQLESAEVQALRDLAALVEREFNVKGGSA